MEVTTFSSAMYALLVRLKLKQRIAHFVIEHLPLLLLLLLFWQM